MKTIRYAFVLLTLSCPLLAELNEDYYTAEDLLAKSSLKGEEDQSPFSMDLSFEGTDKAKFEHKRGRKRLDDVQFAVAEIDGSAVFYYNPCCKEGLLATLAYSHTKIKWKNPFFKQEDFNTVAIALAGFSGRACDWLWKGEVRLNADVDGFNINRTLYWNLVLVGRYAYTEDLGLYMGFIAYTGMKIDRIYPVLGFDWEINERWKLSLVVPTNIGVVYSFTKQWAFSLSSRFIDERFRVDKEKKEAWREGLIEYRATGVEAGVTFTSCNEKWVANFHVGEILGGQLRIAKRHYNDKKRFRFRTAPYLGGEIAGRF